MKLWFSTLVFFASILSVQIASTANAQDSRHDQPVPSNGVENGDYHHADDTQPFSETELDQSAEIFVTRQRQVWAHVFQLEAALEEKRQSLLLLLGKERIEKIKTTMARPGKTLIQRFFNSRRLKQLNADEFLKMDLADDESIRTIGARVYEQRVFRVQNINEFAIEIPGVGRAEPNSIEKVVIPRIVEEMSGVAFLGLPNELMINSTHFNKYVARIAYFSNLGQGRPTVGYVAHDLKLNEDTNPSLKYRFYDLPKTRLERAKNWWRATFEMPDGGALIMAGLAMTAEVTTAAGITHLDHWFNHAPIDYTAAKLSVPFSLAFTAFGSFYTNATAAKDKLSSRSRAKAMMTRMVLGSMTFAYCLQILEPNGGLHSLTLLTTGGWMKHLDMWGKNFTAALVKDQTKKISDIREDMGKNRGTVKILGKTLKENQLERNGVKQVTNIPRMLAIMNLKLDITSKLSIPIGPLALYSTFFVAPYAIYLNAKKHRYEHIDELEQKIQKTSPIYFAIQAAKTVWRTPQYSKASIQDLIASPNDFLTQGLEGIKEDLSSIGSIWTNCLNAMKGREPSTPTIPPPFEASDSNEWFDAIL